MSLTPEPGPADPTPDRIGPYRILSVLGEGGMGTVSLAEQREPVRRRVALKVIKLGMDSKQVLVRFEAERQALAMMNHDHIAKVFEAGSTPRGQPFFAMEHVPGLPITDHCDKHRLTNKQRLELLVQVCAGVQHAHQKGVIHRDLKPTNVLVTVEQGRAVPKIIDFGLARATDQRLVEATLFTEQGQIVGTPEYMSPEQAEMTSQDIDTRTDVYSLGVLSYELLVGSLPFARTELRQAGLLEIQRKIREDEPPRPSTRINLLGAASDRAAELRCTNRATLRRELRGDLDWIVMMAMDKDRNRRYPTAAALADDLQRHLRHEPVVASPPSASYRVRKLIRRYRGQVIAGAAVFVVLVAGVVTSSVFAVTASRRAEQIEAQKTRADTKVDEFNMLANVVLLRSAKATEESFACRPDKIEVMQRWLDNDWARLQSALPKLLRTVADLRARAQPAAEGESTWQFRTEADKFLHDTLLQAAADIEKFGSDEVPIVRQLLDWAHRVEALSIDAHRTRWNAARAALRQADDVVASEHYAGQPVDFAPQMGLVPIGMNPATRLWEFYDPRSAADPSVIPTHGTDGSVAVTEGTGIVFVLVPGGTFWMGAQKDDADQPGYDALTDGDAQPVHRVTLARYFLARHELTRGQWSRLASGSDPSWWTRRSLEDATQPLGVHPVESVSWDLATRVLRRAALQLPTEAQWEYACRAGTTTPWHTGATSATLHGAANVLDATAFGKRPTWREGESYEDGFWTLAPVGSFQANAFGMFDMHGNVMEWCRDAYGQFDLAWGEGDGLRQVVTDSLSPDRPIRGGSFLHPGSAARSAGRVHQAPAVRFYDTGLRPARAITR